MMFPAALHLLAASRTNPAIKDLGMCVGLGLFIAAVSVALIYFGAKKRGQTMDRAFYQKLVMYGVFGLICGYFSMRITIKNNPEAFHGKQAGSSSRDQRVKNILENPIPNQPEIKLEVVDSLRKPLSPEELEERRRQSEIRQAQIDAAHKAAAGYDREEDRAFLESLDLPKLEQVIVERKSEKEEATQHMRELNAKDSDATTEKRRAASMRFSVAVRALMEANKVRLEKKRQSR